MHLTVSNNTGICASSMVYTFTLSPWWSGIVTTIVYEFALYPLIRNKVPSSMRRIGGAALLNLLLNVLNLIGKFCPNHFWGTVFAMGAPSGFLLVLLINGITRICVRPVTIQHARTSDWLRDVSTVSLAISELLS